ncbi:Signal transduction histidine kinase [Ekhidna lutea]|uniref:histidine kinase n=1 Tax=Ekhidna lutea TaxID=447679 RepID=A0A239JFB5_EKHLU|nr:Signal transduction histidine kinase [Ekhidna lutea]
MLLISPLISLNSLYSECQLLSFHIKHILPTTDRSLKIELRLFEIILILTVSVFLFWSVYGFIIGYEYFVQTVYTTGIFIYLVLYILQKKGIGFRKLSLTYYYLALLLIGISWFPSGGLKAAIPTFLGLVYLSGLLVLPLKDYLVFIIVTFGMVLGLILYEIKYPDAPAPYLSEELLIQDIAISTLTSLVIMGICLFIFKRTYIDDRRLLRKNNKELEKEKLKAESADQAKTTFLATISHEMRTPLNGIVGMTELLTKTDLNKEQQELVESLGYSSNILHGLISNVLDITIIEAGKLELHMSSFSSQKEFNALWRVFEKKINVNPDVKLHLEVDDLLPEYLSGDLPRIRQVLVNLLNNAIKFTIKGSITISISVVGQAGDVVSVKFSIKDTGTGISLDKQAHLFETFYKSSEEADYEGTGLGLPIVDKLVRLMGGTIDFKSEPQKGSEFSFILPLGVAKKEDLEGFEKIVVPGLSDLKILIVEDVEINRLVAQKMLKTLGITHIEMAINGTEGVQKASKQFYDIILMDLQMPDISGFEASRQISSVYETENQKPIIIALTANAMKNSMEECSEAGMSDYILKPIKSETLKQVLMKYMNY